MERERRFLKLTFCPSEEGVDRVACGLRRYAKENPQCQLDVILFNPVKGIARIALNMKSDEKFSLEV